MQESVHSAMTPSRLRALARREVSGLIAAGAVHDLLNLNGVMRGYAELIQGRNSDPQVRAFAENILLLSQTTEKILERVSAFAHGEQEQWTICRIAHVLGSFEHMMGPIFRDRRQHLSIEIPTHAVWVVRIRETAIQQVLCNLAFNALDALAIGGTLAVEASEMLHDGSPHLLHIRITDNGAGMDAVTLRNVFAPFFTTKKTKGTGLGCATAKLIVEEHGGSMTVESALGVGTTFHIYLPVCAS